jgi:protein phosphatase 2C family protein 2/3
VTGGRVNGNLSLSRAIGDFKYKQSDELSPEEQIVTAYPDVMVHEITDDDEFLVITCDGKFSDNWQTPHLC